MSYLKAYKQLDGIEGWFSLQQTEVVFSFVKDLKPNSLIVEIGTYHGRSAKLWTVINPQINVLTIDLVDFPERPNNIPSTIDKDVLNSGSIFQVLGDANDIAKGFNWDIDFLFIDGNHEYKAVKKDIEKWIPHLKKGCFVAFHDYEPTHEGVIKAVSETNLIKIVAKDGICICRKDK